jgi:hypothetical protein
VNARTEFAMEPQAHPSLRRAAVALHGAGREDQAWLLAQLDPAHRAELEALLGDLADLGIPRDRSVVEELLRNAAPASLAPDMPSKPAPAARSATEQALLVLRSAAPRHLAEVLRNEPAALVAHVLAHLPAGARTRCLERLAAPARRAVQERLHGSYQDIAADGTVELAPRQSEVLLKELAARLGQPKPGATFLRRASARWSVLRRLRIGKPA